MAPILFGATLCIAAMLHQTANAQVKYGQNPTTINANSLLELEHTSKGLLLPRVALTGTTTASPMSAHVAGMTVYNTATAGTSPTNVIPGLYYNDGTQWVRLSTDSSSSWLTTGNAGTSAGTNFLGTTDDVDLVFKRNNTIAGWIDSAFACTSFGAGSLPLICTGTDNVAVGYQAMAIDTLGAYNTATGSKTLNSNTSGSFNTAVGSLALFDNTTAGSNTAVGFTTMFNNTTGGNNTAIGSAALYNNVDGYNNTANGASALASNTSGYENTASGEASLNSNTTGYQNVANGTNALLLNTTGYENVADGYMALFLNTKGDSNTATGNMALYNNDSGNNNTAVGYAALYNSTGSNNTGLGHNAQVPSSSGSNQMVLGDTNISYAGVQVAWTITSDARWKKEVHNIPIGLNLVQALRPVDYTRINHNGGSKQSFNGNTRECGFIAQEVEKTLLDLGYTNSGIITKDENGHYGMRYNDLIPVLVKAIQEQQSVIDQLKTQHALDIAAIKAELEALKTNNTTSSIR